ncbi:MAG: cyclic nucleotide-degrading phosphodiesterase [Mycobacteriaceae bacterium]
MRMTVLGCSGSVTGPQSAASGYLITAEDAPPFVIDFGGGVLGALQRHHDPGQVAVLLSHLHADHCLDLPGLFVWRRYHPTPPKGRTQMFGPTDSALRIGLASAEVGGQIDDFSDVMDLQLLHSGVPVTLGGITVVPHEVNHPPESFGFRVTSSDGRVFAYSGDTGVCENLVELARDADVFLCEASWTHAPGVRPLGIHLSGTEAGEVAQQAGVGELLLTHIPPWTSREDVLAEARLAFSGPVHAVSADEVFDIGVRSAVKISG